MLMHFLTMWVASAGFTGSAALSAAPAVAILLQDVSATQPAAESGADEQEKQRAARKKAREQERNRKKTEQSLEVARLKLKKAELTAESGKRESEAAVIKARSELDLARRKLAQFDERTAPSRLANGELGIQRAEDREREAVEELAQLEAMYKEEAIVDATREIVVERGRRRLERTRRQLEIERGDFEALKSLGLPIDRTELEQKVDERVRGLEKAELDQGAKGLEQEISLLAARHEVERLEQELADILSGDEDEEPAAGGRKKKREEGE